MRPGMRRAHSIPKGGSVPLVAPPGPTGLLHRADSSPPLRGVPASAPAQVEEAGGTGEAGGGVEGATLPPMPEGGGERALSGLSLALMGEPAEGDEGGGDAAAAGGRQEGLVAMQQQQQQQQQQRRAALHHPPPQYGYGYNHAEYPAAGGTGTGTGTCASALPRSHTSNPSPGLSAGVMIGTGSPSPMALLGGSPSLDGFVGTPPLSQGLAMAAAASMSPSGEASLRRAGLLPPQQPPQQHPADDPPGRSPPFAPNPTSLRPTPAAESIRARRSGSPLGGRTSLGTLPPNLSVPVVDGNNHTRSGGTPLPPLTSLDLLRTSPFKASASSMGGTSSALQQASIHNQNVGGSGNVNFSLLSSLSGAHSPYDTPYGSTAFPQSPGASGMVGGGFSSRLGPGAFGGTGRAFGSGSAALYQTGPQLAAAQQSSSFEEMPFAVDADAATSPSLQAIAGGAGAQTSQQLSAMGGSRSGSQLLVASFAHKCATAGRLKMFSESTTGPGDSEGTRPARGGGGSEEAEDGMDRTPVTDKLDSQLADLREFGASLVAQPPVSSSSISAGVGR